ncbi:MAG: hypothetical protein JEZ07_09070 [Phycisphaerae bacterium]|nr:hypothetical protein [Phycisphaerae bacterium]
MKTHKSNRKMIAQRGSALLLAMVITMILFVMGFAFMSATRVDQEAVTKVNDRKSLDVAVDAVIEKISDTLVTDLFDQGGTENSANKNNFLEGKAAYDYPDVNDQWLANLEPEETTFIDTYNSKSYLLPWWNQITDLWGNFSGSGSVSGYYESLGRPADRLNSIGSGNYGIVGPFVEAKIIPEDQIIDEVFWYDSTASYLYSRWRGAPADADGDGIADSRWDVVPGLTGPHDERIYAAVRIIDNGGMININTAYRNPDDATFSNTGTAKGKWDGTQLGHVNLGGIMADGDVTKGRTPADIQLGRRYGAKVYDPSTLKDQDGDTAALSLNDIELSYSEDINNEMYLARRLSKPHWFNETTGNGFNAYYSPFDMTDEMELRNRLLLTSSTFNSATSTAYRYKRISNIWPTTFDPWPGAVGATNPYVSSIGGWYDKMKADIDQGGTSIGNYNRRHLATTYNADREITPKISETDLDSFFKDAWSGNVAKGVPGRLTISGYEKLRNGTQLKDIPNSDKIEKTYGAINVPEILQRIQDRTREFLSDGTTKNPKYESNTTTRKSKNDEDTAIIAAAIWHSLSGVTEDSPRDTKVGAILEPLPIFRGNDANVNEQNEIKLTEISRNTDKLSYYREVLACQMAANLIDHFDTDDEVTEFVVNTGGNINKFYGFEFRSPKLFIGQVVYCSYRTETYNDPAKDPAATDSSTEDDTTPTDKTESDKEYYAIELYNPGPVDVELKDFQLIISKNEEGNDPDKSKIGELNFNTKTIRVGESVFITNAKESEIVREGATSKTGIYAKAGVEFVQPDTTDSRYTTGFTVVGDFLNDIMIELQHNASADGTRGSYIVDHIGAVEGGLGKLSDFDIGDEDVKAVNNNTPMEKYEQRIVQHDTERKFVRLTGYDSKDDGKTTNDKEPDEIIMPVWDNDVDPDINRRWVPYVKAIDELKLETTGKEINLDGTKKIPIFAEGIRSNYGSDGSKKGYFSDTASADSATAQTLDDAFTHQPDIYDILTFGTMAISEDRGNSTFDKKKIKVCTIPEFWRRLSDTTGSKISDSRAGRFSMYDPKYQGMMSYFSIFNPRNDGFDYNNNGFIDSYEGIDNNGDGTANEEGEDLVFGRININTAPWYVIAQLPWVQDLAAVDASGLSGAEYELARYQLARAICAYRDKDAIWNGSDLLINYGEPKNAGESDWTSWFSGSDSADRRKSTRQYMMGVDKTKWDEDFNEDKGFSRILELLNVTYDPDKISSDRHSSLSKNGNDETIREFGSIERYGRNEDSSGPINDNETEATITNNVASHPFYDETDSFANDDKEKAILFKRISNLVTVRSDVFTVYILVRLGQAGPQKRYIAVFDRSNCTEPDHKPRMMTMYQVPDTY